ncbi:unnamed protein product [Bursaphelenchus xylophilus]|uniref:Chloride channel CLIC-like protein 1 n=1 Tax=Bursaphelenchus xylophilus TaxID=6326 RepID=A0A1I7RTZ1_BURXY|nr:unnamed protein product [Bursaphelenchus xylophilus]CAG9132079.1 unnamed protein product [Bursaphelenchus xylophilus]
MAINFLVLTCFTHLILQIQATSSELDIDKSGWLDVNDPLSWENTQNQRDRGTCPSEEAVSEYQRRISQLEKEILIGKASSEEKLLKHVVRQFLHRLNIELVDGQSVYRDAQVYISAKDVRILRRFLNNEYPDEDVGIRERVRTALGEFLSEASEQTPIFVQYLQPYTPYLMLLNIAILPIALLFILQRIMSPKQLLIILFLWAFCVSFCFTYARKYKEKLAERYDRADREDQCIKDKTFLGEVSDVLLGYLRIKGKSECLKKYEDILIEPFLLIDPLATFGEVLANFFMSPLEVAGKQLNRFFNDFFIDTPLPLAVFKVVFLFLLLFFFMGYRLRTLLFSVEPVFRPQEPAIQRTERASEAIRTRETTPMIQEVRSCPTLPAPTPPQNPAWKEASPTLAIEDILEELDFQIEEEEVKNEEKIEEEEVKADEKIEEEEVLDIRKIFYAHLTYEESENLLRNEEKGAWLLRNSQKMPSNMAMSIRGPNRCHHFIIYFTEELNYRLGDSKTTFGSLQNLLRHYTRHPVLNEGPTTLDRPLFRDIS